MINLERTGREAKQLVIIGAGPIGLEAALYAEHLGFDVKVLEKSRVGANMLDWGHVTLFSPWYMNHSPLAVAKLRHYFPAWREPERAEYLTGKQYVEAYLLPLSESPQLANRIHTDVKVKSIGRERILKGDMIGKPDRTSYPFRILTSEPDGNERIYRADIVIDASGVYGSPNWLGEGGIPAIGETKCRRWIDYRLVDVYGADRSRFAGRKTLLIGSGYSAATTICGFHNLIREEPGTSVLWTALGSRSIPIAPIDNDPLPNRASLTNMANALAQNGPGQIEFRNNTTIDSIHYSEKEDQFTVGLRRGGALERIEVDRIVANVGYGPDNAIYRELQVHECYASRGPMKLSAALLGASSTDCLEQTSMGADTLKNPEPNFFIIGNKSYGRNSTFLIRVGLSQIVEAFALITGDGKLNLYDQVLSKNGG